MKKSVLLSGVVSLAFLAACGGGGGGDSNTTSDTNNTGGGSTLTGIFADAPVDGLEYVASPSGLSGTTSNGGKFQFKEGDTVTFKIGQVTLGDVKPSSKETIITPLDLYEDAKDVTDPRVKLALRLLQTLDSDSDPTNGIDINKTLNINLDIETDVDDTNYQGKAAEVDDAIDNDSNTTTLMDENTAINNFTSNTYYSPEGDVLTVSGNQFTAQVIDDNGNVVTVSGDISDIAIGNDNPSGFKKFTVTSSSNTSFIPVGDEGYALWVPGVGYIMMFEYEEENDNGTVLARFNESQIFASIGQCPTANASYNYMNIVSNFNQMRDLDPAGVANVTVDNNGSISMTLNTAWYDYASTSWSYPDTVDTASNIQCSQGILSWSGNGESAEAVITKSGLIFGEYYVNNSYDHAFLGGKAPSNNVCDSQTPPASCGALANKTFIGVLNWFGDENGDNISDDILYPGKIVFDNSGSSASYYAVTIGQDGNPTYTQRATIQITGELAPGLLTATVDNQVQIIFSVGTVTDSDGTQRMVIFGREANMDPNNFDLSKGLSEFIFVELPSSQ